MSLFVVECLFCPYFRLHLSTCTDIICFDWSTLLKVAYKSFSVKWLEPVLAVEHEESIVCVSVSKRNILQ